jgi:hypothetical protein
MLTLAEHVVFFLPMVLPIAFFVVIPARPQYGFTESGKKYLKVDSPTHVPLLSTRAFWFVFSASLAVSTAWALTEAIVSAIQSGTVSLPDDPRTVVPWIHAWAYLVGLAALLSSAVLPDFAARDTVARAWLTVAAALFGTVGYLLVMFAEWLSSWVGTSLLALTFVVAFAVTQRERHEA